jgi:hypothetical protein
MNKRLKAVFAIIITGIVGYFLAKHIPEIKTNVAKRDSIAYWAAGRLLARQGNPYDYDSVLRLEREYGYSEERPLVFRTPPWSLFMTLPLGLLTPLWAWLLWTATTVGCLLAGMHLSRKMYGVGSVPANLLTLAGYTFAPITACLMSGQMGLVLMLGIVLFLWWERDHPFLAGSTLVLPFAKPHLLAVFWLVLLLWVVRKKNGKIVLGFATAFLLAMLAAFVLDPHIFQQYRAMLQRAAIQNEFIPALSGVVRLIFFRSRFWMQFIPMILGFLWGIAFFLRRESGWNWRQDGPALLVMSVLTTPYAWFADETVLLPAILQAVAFVYGARASLKLLNLIALAFLMLLDLLLLLILNARVPFATGIYFWSSPVWFFLYFHAHKLHVRSRLSSSETAPGMVTQAVS